MLFQLKIIGDPPSGVEVLKPWPENASSINAKLAQEKCPKCGSPVACIYWENGQGNYFNDNFVHQCASSKCNHELTERWEESGGISPYEKEWPNCPFCERAAVSC